MRVPVDVEASLEFFLSVHNEEIRVFAREFSFSTWPSWQGQGNPLPSTNH